MRALFANNPGNRLADVNPRILVEYAESLQFDTRSWLDADFCLYVRTLPFGNAA